MDSTLAAGDGSAPTRRGALLRALLAPVAVTLLGIAPFLLLPRLDGADRALVWIEGDAATLRRVEAAIATESAFAGGTRHDANGRPSTCSADAVRLHFEVRRVDEAQLTRDVLERLARDAGAVVCASDRFELGRADDVAAWWALLASIVLPLGVLAALRGVGAGGRRAPPRIAPETVTAALAIALLATVFAAPPFGATGGLATLLGFAMATVPPVIHESAFRAWMIPRLQPAFGAAASGILSFAASIAAGAATGLAAAATGALIGAACVVVYFATRSLAACIAVHLLLATLGRTITG